MTEEQKTELREFGEWCQKRNLAAAMYLKEHGITPRMGITNQEIEIVMASAFAAGARWERDRQC